MAANANKRAIKAIMRKCDPDRKLNILTFATHERYEENLCKTGHNFYSLPIGKTWDTDYAPVPDNYHIISTIPDYVDFDLILTHTSCDRMFKAHQLLSGSDITRETRRVSRSLDTRMFFLTLDLMLLIKSRHFNNIHVIETHSYLIIISKNGCLSEMS